MLKEIKRITGNNKTYAEMAFTITKGDCWWITDATDVSYLRNATTNEWVAIPGAYADEEVKSGFRTTQGNYVVLGGDDSGNYIATTEEA
jgi:hypothetical protein